MRAPATQPKRAAARILAGFVTIAVLASTALSVAAAEPNNPPIAVDDPGPGCGIPSLGGAFPIPEGWAEPFLLTLTCAPLRNDTDADGDPLTAELVTGPDHGVATLWHTQDPSFNGATYLPDLDYSTRRGDEPGGTWDSDRFTYRVTDGQAWSEPATYSVWVVPVNDPPTFAPGPDVIEVDQDSGPYSAPWASSIDPGPYEEYQEVHFEVTDIDLHGLPHLFAVNPAIDGDGTLAFTPGLHEYGLATVTVRAVDDGGLEDWNEGPRLREQPDDTSDEVTFTIVVWPNNPPEAVPDEGINVYQGPGTTKLDLLANDTDPDGDALSIVSATQAEHGTVAVVQDGAFVTYDPVDGYVGQDWFQYTVEDARGATSGPQFVVIDVRPDTVTPKMGALNRSLPGQTIGSSTVVATISWAASDVGSGVAGYQLQVSVNGAGYRAVPLANPAATSTRTTLTVGASYGYRIRAKDRAGNVGGYAYWPIVTPTRYQETSTIARYTGTWSRAVSSHLSGGASRYASSTTRRVTVTFTGREVAWVATKRTTGGRAQVRIDGVLVGTVDLDATSTQYRRIVFRRGFTTRATHTLEIRPLGDGRVELDAIIVLR